MKRYFDAVALLLVALFVSLAASNSMALGTARGSDTVLIVPARPAVLKLAFDLENMRDVTIVSFRAPASPASPGFVKTSAKAHGAPSPVYIKPADEPLIHVWKGTDWQYVPFSDFCAMAFIDKAPRTAILIGDDRIVPRKLLQNMNWPCKIERLQTLNAADLLNGLNPYFDFSSREWKRLADSYGLQIEDLNAAKRSFNPYDIPRSKTPLTTHEFKQEKDDAPPAVLIEKSGDQNKAPDPSTLK